jgi:hypothetical protein
MKLGHAPKKIAPRKVMRRREALGQKGEITPCDRGATVNACDRDLTRIRRAEIEQALHERRLPRAVLSDEPEKDASGNIEIHTGQYLMGSERFRNAPECERRAAMGWPYRHGVRF